MSEKKLGILSVDWREFWRLVQQRAGFANSIWSWILSDDDDDGVIPRGEYEKLTDRMSRDFFPQWLGMFRSGDVIALHGAGGFCVETNDNGEPVFLTLTCKDVRCLIVLENIPDRGRLRVLVMKMDGDHFECEVDLWEDYLMDHGYESVRNIELTDIQRVRVFSGRALFFPPS